MNNTKLRLPIQIHVHSLRWFSRKPHEIIWSNAYSILMDFQQHAPKTPLSHLSQHEMLTLWLPWKAPRHPMNIFQIKTHYYTFYVFIMMFMCKIICNLFKSQRWLPCCVGNSACPRYHDFEPSAAQIDVAWINYRLPSVTILMSFTVVACVIQKIIEISRTTNLPLCFLSIGRFSLTWLKLSQLKT